jgi:hypothetical protein
MAVRSPKDSFPDKKCRQRCYQVIGELDLIGIEDELRGQLNEIESYGKEDNRRQRFLDLFENKPEHVEF